MSRPHDNHHLWRNGRFWWVAFAALDGVRQVRAYERRAGWAVPLRIA
jgi:hypothetical protein